MTIDEILTKLEALERAAMPPPWSWEARDFTGPDQKLAQAARNALPHLLRIVRAAERRRVADDVEEGHEAREEYKAALMAWEKSHE